MLLLSSPVLLYLAMCTTIPNNDDVRGADRRDVDLEEYNDLVEIGWPSLANPAVRNNGQYESSQTVSHSV
jgi:hypothetical protein